MKRKSCAGVGLSIFMSAILSGCGARVPEYEEFWASPGDTAIKVQEVVGQVECELREAVRAYDASDIKQSEKDGVARRALWLDTWSAQVTLILTIDEKSALSPGLSFNTLLPNATGHFHTGNVTAPQSFSFGLGASLSSEATRIDKLHLFYELKDFVGPPPSSLTCIPTRNADGSLFMNSDLKLRQWLSIGALPAYLDNAKYPVKPVSGVQDVLSHEVKFEIISSGNVTPTWKLVRVSANTGTTPLFGTTRDRTQDLIITMGPTQTAAGSPALSTAAQNASLASEIGASVAAAIRNLQ